jgi:ribonucleotide reductase beta subunit family protein with ferritin-like domain
MHCDFAVHLHHMLLRPAAPLTICTIISDAMEIKSNFVHAALPCELIGMNANLMVQYMQFCADRLLTELGQPKIIRVDNPFHFMELISLQSKTNFFEKQVSEYALSGVGDTENHHVFDLDVTF